MQSSSWLMVCFMLMLALFILVFYVISRQSTIKYLRLSAKKFTIWFIMWVLLQISFAVSGLYSYYTSAIPPKIVLFGIFPAFLGLGVLFFIKKGKLFLQSLPLDYLVILQMFRIPIEFILAALFFEKLVPKQMTFFGSNFDILIGISAPIVAYLYFAKCKISRQALLIWNFIGVFFIFHIVLVAFLSAPSPLQKINFDQPNIAILHFPYALIATVFVPVLLLSHFVCIKRLWVSKREDTEASELASQLYKTETAS